MNLSPAFQRRWRHYGRFLSDLFRAGIIEVAEDVADKDTAVHYGRKGRQKAEMLYGRGSPEVYRWDVLLNKLLK